MDIGGCKLTYLKKNKCEFAIVHNTCIFRHNKRYEVYEKGLRNLVRDTTRRDCMLRIFLNKTIKNWQQFDATHTEIILYEFDQDVGTFGTFVRLSPMFDFFTDERYQTIVDVDVKFENLDFDKKLKMMKKHEASYGVMLVECPALESRMSMLTGPCCVYANIIFRGQLPQQIFIDFLKGVHLDEKWTNFCGLEFFKYGFEEYFLNEYVVPEMIKKKCIGSFMFWQLPAIHYDVLKLHKKWHSAIEDGCGMKMDAIDKKLYAGHFVFNLDRKLCSDYYKALAKVADSYPPRIIACIKKLGSLEFATGDEYFLCGDKLSIIN